MFTILVLSFPASQFWMLSASCFYSVLLDDCGHMLHVLSGKGEGMIVGFRLFCFCFQLTMMYNSESSPREGFGSRIGSGTHA
jgi:hypothetical protein